MRLVDADAIIPKGTRITPNNVDLATAIRFAPTIDAVPVVRCKDCKHWKFAQHINDNLCHRFDGDPWIPTEPNDFCSYGVRKEGADNG